MSINAEKSVEYTSLFGQSTEQPLSNFESWDLTLVTKCIGDISKVIH